MYVCVCVCVCVCACVCVAVLVLFFTNQLSFGENTATAIYHAFIVLCYLLPLLGAMVSDSFLGKYG